MSSRRLNEYPEEDLPRERLAALGAGALSNHELIALLLGTGVNGTNVMELSKQMLKDAQSLGSLARYSFHDFTAIRGIGPAKATHLAAAFELGHRLARERLAKQKMDSPEAIYELLGAEMCGLAKESLRVVLLDTRYQFIKVHEVSLGSLNESIAHPREIFQPVLTHSAFAFILVHNHPSGDPAPSEADRRLTIRLNEAAKLMQIQMLDHVIVGSHDDSRAKPYFSFREAGII